MSADWFLVHVGIIGCNKLSCVSCISKEMYPPKVHQFAYVTDEACTEDDILSMEIIIMKVTIMHHPVEQQYLRWF